MLFDQESSYSKVLAKQERLVYLHHSSTCTDKNCTVTPMCGELQRLWRHLPECKDPECPVPHCNSSRLVLNHYKKCKNRNGDDQCQICQPLRNIIRREKEERYERNECMRVEDDNYGRRDSSTRQRGKYSESPRHQYELEDLYKEEYRQKKNSRKLSQRRHDYYDEEKDHRRSRQYEYQHPDKQNHHHHPAEYRQKYHQKKRHEEYHPNKLKHQPNTRHPHDHQRKHRNKSEYRDELAYAER